MLGSRRTTRSPSAWRCSPPISIGQHDVLDRAAGADTARRAPASRSSTPSGAASGPATPEPRVAARLVADCRTPASESSSTRSSPSCRPQAVAAKPAPATAASTTTPTDLHRPRCHDGGGRQSGDAAGEEVDRHAKRDGRSSSRAPDLPSPTELKLLPRESLAIVRRRRCSIGMRAPEGWVETSWRRRCILAERPVRTAADQVARVPAAAGTASTREVGPDVRDHLLHLVVPRFPISNRSSISLRHWNETFAMSGLL